MNNPSPNKLLESPMERFLYWIEARHRVYLRREAGHKPPWTQDEILGTYFFTNPWREHDKTTVWFRRHVRQPLETSHDVIMATIIFRWFNYIPTGELLLEHGLLRRWKSHLARRVLQERAKTNKVFTGAFIVKSPDGFDKVNGICNCIDNVWAERTGLCEHIEHVPTLEGAHAFLMNYPYLGGFMSYEIVSDLRHTRWLRDATDIDTWCFLGPGANRGLRRVCGLPAAGPRLANALDICQQLLSHARQRFPDHPSKGGWPIIEMREIEHSLCEFDKYERAHHDEGTLKRRFHPVRKQT